MHVHAAYLRVYVTVTGRAAVYLPCPSQGRLSLGEGRRARATVVIRPVTSHE